MQKTIQFRTVKPQLFAPPPAIEGNSASQIFRWLFPLLMILLLPEFRISAQNSECSSPDPDDALYLLMRSQVPEIRAKAQNRNLEAVTEIPVFYTVFRNSNGLLGGAINNITNTDIDLRIDFLNLKFAGTGVHFYRLGNVNYIDNKQLNESNAGEFVRESYSYVKTALNVYISPYTAADVGSTPAFESDFAGKGALQLVDMNGKTLYFQIVDFAKGINTLSLGSLEISSLPAGVLPVILQTDTNVFTGRLVKL